MRAWKNNDISWEITDQCSCLTDYLDGSNGSYKNIIKHAFATWGEFIDLNFSEVSEGASADISFTWTHIDGKGGFGGETTTSHKSSRIYDSEIKIDKADFNPASLDDPKLFYKLVLHEIGHALGAGHSNDPNSIMYHTLSYSSEISNADIERMQAVYGRAKQLDSATSDVIEYIYGTSGANTLRGIDSDEEIFGGAGSDRIFGGAGADRIWGGKGNDRIDAQAGDGTWQFVSGQDGNDTYIYFREQGKVLIDNRFEGAGQGRDTIIFKDLKSSDLSLVYSYQGDHLKTAISLVWNEGEATGELKIGDMGRHIEKYIFADGIEIEWSDLRSAISRELGEIVGEKDVYDKHADYIGSSSEDNFEIGADGTDGYEIFAGHVDGRAGIDNLDLPGNASDYSIYRHGEKLAFINHTLDGRHEEGRLIATAVNIESFEGADISTYPVQDGYENRATHCSKIPSELLSSLRDFDGNEFGAESEWRLVGTADVQFDGDAELIYINPTLGRWATVGPDENGSVDFDNHGENGETRVVGIYIDPLVASGQVEKGSDHDSQTRFENDLRTGNLTLVDAFDFDGDGLQEIYFRLEDGTAYLRALMHADGNIQYANYQSAEQVDDYLLGLGYSSEVISDIIF